MKLILCAGDRHVPGFTHHDVQGDQDILCDLFDITQHVKPESCEEIQFTHALEHFPTKDTPKILDLIYSLVRPGGRVYIEVPNFEWHARLVLEEHRDKEAVYYAFGGQLDEYDFHKTAFTESILRGELEDAGFQNIEISNSSSLEARMNK